jgi:hypothetical protein
LHRIGSQDVKDEVRIHRCFAGDVLEGIVPTASGAW